MSNTETQSEALRLAQGLIGGGNGFHEWLKPSAIELRRLHAENEVLKVQLTGANERAQMLCRQKELWRERAAAQAHSVEDVLERTGQYVTNDASREAAIAEAVAAEREACAFIAETVDLHIGDHLKNSDPRKTCAEAIRARGQKGGA